MKRLHIVGGKNHGKTTLVVDLVRELARRGVSVGTIKHTHHHHELDVPGKDSHCHRKAGAKTVGILSPTMTAVFQPTPTEATCSMDRYASFAPLFETCQLVLVEGDSQTTAPKIEVWRSEMGTPPLVSRDPSILAVVTDGPFTGSASVLPRRDVPSLVDWILSRFLNETAEGNHC